jgi:hypothetical protein
MPATRPITERFWEKVDKRPGHGPWGDCWVWAASLNNHGYGRIGFNGKNEYAHRVAWFLQYGKWPKPFALHRCDTPSCVRWDHLFEGNHRANAQDAIQKKRTRNIPAELNLAKTHCDNGHPFSQENTYVVKKTGHRVCRECSRNRTRERYNRLGWRAVHRGRRNRRRGNGGGRKLS